MMMNMHRVDIIAFNVPINNIIYLYGSNTPTNSHEYNIVQVHITTTGYIGIMTYMYNRNSILIVMNNAVMSPPYADLSSNSCPIVYIIHIICTIDNEVITIIAAQVRTQPT